MAKQTYKQKVKPSEAVQADDLAPGLGQSGLCLTGLGGRRFLSRLHLTLVDGEAFGSHRRQAVRCPVVGELSLRTGTELFRRCSRSCRLQLKVLSGGLVPGSITATRPCFRDDQAYVVNVIEPHIYRHAGPGGTNPLWLDAWDKGVRMTCKRRGQSVPDPLDPFAPPDGSRALGGAFWGVTTERFRSVRPCATVRRGPDPARELTVCRPGYEPAGTAGAHLIAASGAGGSAICCYGKSEVFRRPAGCGSPLSPSIPDSANRPRRLASCAKAGGHDEGEGWAGSGNRWGAVPEPCETRRNLGAHLGREPDRIVNTVVGVRQDSLVFPPACQHGRTHSWHIT